MSQHPESLGPYRLGRLLGRGGMGEVYRATDTRLNRDVALKVLPTEFASDPDRLSRFEREARAAAALSHPNILSLFDVGTDRGTPYFVSELLEGETLRARLDRGPLPIQQAVSYAAQIARGLAAAHDGGIVHRDIKPDNIFVTTDERVKILDFGIARVDTGRAGSGVENATTEAATAAGTFVGTFPYMSPEQVRGEPADARSDIFALGTLLCEMLTGRSPFAAGTPAETISAILTVDPTSGWSASTLPQPLVEVVRHCLEKNPRQRFQSAHDVAFGLSVLAPAPTARETSGSPRRRRWAIAAGLSAIVIAGAALLLDRSSFRQPSAGASGPRSIATLPFKSLAAGGTDDYFADGMTDSLITDLAKVEGLVVLARSAVFRYKDQDVDPQKVGRELGAQYILQGSVQREGARVRVNAQLIDTVSGFNVWTERMDEDVRDLFALQDRISQRIVSALELRLSPDAGDHASSRRSGNPRAYESYLQGLYHLHKGNEADLALAIPLFERATREDPQFALAFALLGSVYTQKFFYDDADRRWEQQAFVAIERALALDPNLAEAYLARGQLAWSLPNGFPHERTVADLRKAIHLNPGLAGAHRELGKVYFHIGLLDKAIEANTTALRLDPGDRAAQARRAYSYLFQGECAKTLEVAHEADIRIRAQALGCLGRDAEALAVIGSSTDANNLSYRAVLLAKTGRQADARRMLARLDLQANNVATLSDMHHVQYDMGTAHALLGDTREAVTWLKKASREGLPCYPAYANNRSLNRIRSDPEFVEFLRELRAQWERFQATL